MLGYGYIPPVGDGIDTSTLNIRRERKNLALALKDTRSVVGTLTYLIGAIVQLVFFFFYLLILRVCLIWH